MTHLVHQKPIEQPANMKPQMSPDDCSWEQAEETSDKRVRQFLDIENTLKPNQAFVRIHNRDVIKDLSILKRGSYNICFKLTYMSGISAVIRFTQPGSIMFPEEKVANDVALMRFLTDQTSLLVPSVLHSGTKQESPLEISPFILMDHVNHATKMYDALNTPGCPF